MAVFLQLATADIAVDTNGLRQDFHVLPPSGPGSPPQVISHLTRNFRVVTTGITASSALLAVGKVKVSVPSAADPELALWSFGFIQFQRVNEIRFTYQGRTAKDGFILLEPDRPPAMSRKLALDSFDAFPPWTNSAPKGGTAVFQPATGEVICRTGDHPMASVGGTLMNVKTGFPNHLSHWVDDREFWTVFSAIDPNGRFVHLAHFHWAVRWECEFVWRQSLPVVTTRRMPFIRDAIFLGPPKEPFLQSLLANPKGPQANTICGLAIKQTGSRSGIGTPNRSDEAVGSTDPLFFTD